MHSAPATFPSRRSQVKKRSSHDSSFLTEGIILSLALTHPVSSVLRIFFSVFSRTDVLQHVSTTTSPTWGRTAPVEEAPGSVTAGGGDGSLARTQGGNLFRTQRIFAVLCVARVTSDSFEPFDERAACARVNVDQKDAESRRRCRHSDVSAFSNACSDEECRRKTRE